MIGVRGTTVYGLCPGCDTWQVDIVTTAGLDSIDEIEAAISEHARTECVALLRLRGSQHAQALRMLEPQAAPVAEEAYAYFTDVAGQPAPVPGRQRPAVTGDYL